MSAYDDAIRDLVLANRILAHEEVVDAYGHVSVRHPDNPERYLIAVSRSPELVTEADIIECTLDGKPVRDEKRALYLERFIHGGIYESRPDIHSVVHSHALDVLPFTISDQPLRPAIHSSGALGHEMPVWDQADRFGETSLLVVNMPQGRDLAASLSDNRIVLMRAHGFAAAGRNIAESVRLSVVMPRNARAYLGALQIGKVKPLSKGEIDLRLVTRSDAPESYRAWEYWATRAGCADMLPGARRSVTVRKPATAKKAPAKKKAAAKKGAKKARR